MESVYFPSPDSISQLKALEPVTDQLRDLTVETLENSLAACDKYQEESLAIVAALALAYDSHGETPITPERVDPVYQAGERVYHSYGLHAELLLAYAGVGSRLKDFSRPNDLALIDALAKVPYRLKAWKDYEETWLAVRSGEFAKAAGTKAGPNPTPLAKQ